MAIVAVIAKKALSKIKDSFGLVSDGIASHFIYIAFPGTREPLCDIFNFSINTGIFPEVGKSHNYIAISVLPVFSRLFERLVYDQLYHHLDKN